MKIDDPNILQSKSNFFCSQLTSLIIGASSINSENNWCLLIDNELTIILKKIFNISRPDRSNTLFFILKAYEDKFPLCYKLLGNLMSLKERSQLIQVLHIPTEYYSRPKETL